MHIDLPVQIVALVGLGFLLFLAGLEIDADLDIGRDRRLAPGQLPALERAISTTVIAGHDDAHRRAHATIGHWLQAHHCRLAGPGREIVRPQAAGQAATVEILYPVAEVGEADRR